MKRSRTTNNPNVTARKKDIPKLNTIIEYLAIQTYLMFHINR